jgi:hypothetical protein
MNGVIYVHKGTGNKIGKMVKEQQVCCFSKVSDVYLPYRNGWPTQLKRVNFGGSR